MKTLVFEGAGWSGAERSKETIGNCRIRTAFHLVDGRAVYLEMSCCNTKTNGVYDGFITDCFYITGDPDDCNKNRVKYLGNRIIPYTKESILAFANGLNGDFDAIVVAPDLGGYRVFSELGYFNYGDEFEYDEELITKRDVIRDTLYTEEKKWDEFPLCILYVDEADKNVLHYTRQRGENRGKFLIDVNDENWRDNMRIVPKPDNITLADVIRWAARNDPNGEWDEALATAEGDYTRERAHLAQDMCNTLRQWKIDGESTTVLMEQMIQRCTEDSRRW